MLYCQFPDQLAWVGVENCTGQPVGAQSLTRTQPITDPYPWRVAPMAG